MGYKDGRGSVSVAGVLHRGISSESVLCDGRGVRHDQGSTESNCFAIEGSKENGASTFAGSGVGLMVIPQ